MYCFADATGETLGVLLRSANAGANAIADHVTVLDQAIGHRAGDDPALLQRQVQVRTDSAGCTLFVWEARARSVSVAVVARSNAQVHAAISRAVATTTPGHRPCAKTATNAPARCRGAHRARRPSEPTASDDQQEHSEAR